ncbi:MAG: hypothetical protein KBD51_01315 [Candidatus Levybacteria bacterium]|nr:hypothetical protein [Candidatus Levybacteria bacterium]
MPHPAETIASSPAPESQPKQRPTVRTVETLLYEGRTPFLMRSQITLSLYDEGSHDAKTNDSGISEDSVPVERTSLNPRRAVVCSFPSIDGNPERRFRLSLEEAAHISSIQRELTSLKQS